MPGSGASSDPPPSFRLDGYADAVAGLAAALALDRPHVAGLSFGGGVALEFYRRHPALPRSLILASAYAGWKGSLPPAEVQRRLEQALRGADAPPEQFAAEVASSLFSAGTTGPLVDAFLASLPAFHPAGLRAMARSIAEADLRDVLARIAVPTLLIYGAQDVRAPLSVGNALHASIAGSQLTVLDGVGHVSSVEAPDRGNAAIRAFLG